MLDLILEYLPALAAVGVGVVLARVATGLLSRKRAGLRDHYVGDIARLAIIVLTGLVVTLLLPIDNTVRNKLLALVGLLITGIVGFASTSMVGNLMAGFMLRSIGSFRPGDYVRAGAHFGRVTEIGLFHVEIQTEDRDLTTIPNQFLASNAFTVVRASGTVISATVSLGYDLDCGRIEKLLMEAAERSGLRECFVHVKQLGDYSVIYRVAGFLEKVGELLTARSRLHICVLSTLHDNDVEIVSPTFMNQRILDAAARVIPEQSHESVDPPAPALAESVVFDKADRVAKIERLRRKHSELETEIEALREAAKVTEGDELEALQSEIQRRTSRFNALGLILQRAKADDQD